MDAARIAARGRTPIKDFTTKRGGVEMVCAFGRIYPLTRVG